MYSQTLPHDTLCPVLELERMILERTAHYRLFSRRSPHTYYFIEIEYGADYNAEYVGDDYSSAAKLLQLLQENEVTPCTLADIVQDFRRQNI